VTRQILAACRRITEQCLERPLNPFFKNPVDPDEDGLPGYRDCVSRPMALTTVLLNLERDAYRSTASWYRDMCLIYENAIRYHTEASPWGLIAEQLLRDLKRAARGFDDADAWAAVLARETRRLGAVISASPVPRGGDALPTACVRRTDGLGRFPADAVPDVVEQLRALMVRDSARADVLAIVRAVHRKDPPIATGEDGTVVDVDKLKDHALHALAFYARAIE